METRVVVVGNVVLDRTPEGGWVPGGPSLYAARMARALGAEVHLVTRLIADYPEAPFSGIVLRPIAAADVPRYVNTYDPQGNRSQLLLSEGEPIPVEAVKGLEADVLLFAPAFHEIAALPGRLPVVTAVCFQGLLRGRDGDRVVPRLDPWGTLRAFARRGVNGFLSDEDTADPRGLAVQVAAAGATAFVTHGSRGATRYDGATVMHRSPFAARPTDPTGAGDAFATAYAVRLAESGDMDAAFDFAMMAGALAVEGRGLDGIPQREAIEARLGRAAA